MNKTVGQTLWLIGVIHITLICETAKVTGTCTIIGGKIGSS
jgi:hypothetical protein